MFVVIDGDSFYPAREETKKTGSLREWRWSFSPGGNARYTQTKTGQREGGSKVEVGLAKAVKLWSRSK